MLTFRLSGPVHSILVVEDDPDVRRALTELLASEGYKVTATADGGEALETLRAGLRPAVILLDLMMPNCDGWDFRRAQLQDPTFASVQVVLAARVVQFRRHRVCQLGPIELCPKPIQPNELLQMLARLAQVKGTEPAYS